MTPIFMPVFRHQSSRFIIPALGFWGRDHEGARQAVTKRENLMTALASIGLIMEDALVEAKYDDEKKALFGIKMVRCEFSHPSIPNRKFPVLCIGGPMMDRAKMIDAMIPSSVLQ